ncbi:MAG: pseudouridine synthase, partial [Lactobacillus paragasseri]
VKRMFEAVHHFVEKLSREKYAFLTLKSLTSGEYRELTHEEVSRLNHLSD